MQTFWLGLSDDIMLERLAVLKAQKVEVAHYENKGLFISDLQDLSTTGETPPIIILSMSSMKMALEISGVVKPIFPKGPTIILLTSSTNSEDREAFITAGGSEIMIEPVGRVELFIRVHHHHDIEKRRLQLEGEAQQAADMVHTVMESSSDIGKVLEFARNVVAHKGYNEIANTMLQFSAHHFAHTIVEIQTHNEVLRFSNEEITDVDLDKLKLQRSQGRVVKTENCLQINQEHIALFLTGFKQSENNIGAISDTISSLSELANRYILVVNSEKHMTNVEVQRQSSLEFISKEILTSVKISMGVTGKLSELKVGTTLGEPHIKALKIANDNITRLSRLIKFVLQINRQSSASIVADNKAFNVGDLLEKMASVYSAPAKDKSNNAITTNSQKNCSLISNEIIVTQIVCQLIDNAIKFTRDGTITLGAAVLDGPSGELIEISVRDTGQGLTDAELAAFKMDEAINSGNEVLAGFGLLYIRFYGPVLGGKLTVVSDKDKGTCFSFAFPNIPPPPSLSTDVDIELF